VGAQFWQIAVLSLGFLSTACSTVSHKTPQRHPSSYVLLWPVSGHERISQEFRNGFGYHDGIDIPAPKGTKIRAPASGRVVYSGSKFNGYGKLIIIEHDSKFSTLYGHCSKLFVSSGDYVNKGTVIGLVGKTGRASASHLHFEVRQNKKPVDPMEFLQ
jgi:murein DD-endopeptidase MepM/ murein hydrolase activator NlpD